MCHSVERNSRKLLISEFSADIIKYRTRQVTIKYSKGKANARRQKLKEIEDLLKKCEEDCSMSPSPENIGKMENIRNEYELLLSTYRGVR